MNTYGSVIATTISDETANYTVDIPSDASYPLIISAKGGLDVVSGTAPDFEMLSVITKSSEKNANINPFSTLIVKTAQSLTGGINPANLDLASQIVLDTINFGLDTDLVPNPITTEINELNVATVVKSSEVAAEMLRRTRKSLLVSGNIFSEDEIINSLAADLTDGRIDGAGLTATNPLIAATANIVSGQVLIEAIGNDLYVNGAPATTLMDNAITLTSPNATDTTSAVKITQDIIDQTKAAVKIASKMAPDGTFQEILATLDKIPSEATPETARALLSPDNTSAYFDSVITQVVYASDMELEELNATARQYNESMRPPVLSVTASELDTNGFVTLSWAAINAVTCESSGPMSWNSSSSISGKEIVGPVDTSATFTLTCYNKYSIKSTKSLKINTPEKDGASNIPGSVAPTLISNSINSGNSGEFNIVSNSLENADQGEITSSTGNIGVNTSSQIAQPNSTDTVNLVNQENLANTPSSQIITLDWNPNPGSIVGYIVYFGPTVATATTELSNIPVDTTNFDPQAPSAQFDTWRDLAMRPGDEVCFRVRAYNDEGLSDWSSPVCSVIKSQ